MAVKIRRLVTIIVGTALCAVCYGQDKLPEKFRNGTFETTLDGKTAIIERFDSLQTEHYKGTDHYVWFKIKWLSEHEYRLTPNDKTFDRYPNTPKNMEIVVKILKVTSNSYTQETISNVSTKKFLSEVIKIK